MLLLGWVQVPPLGVAQQRGQEIWAIAGALPAGWHIIISAIAGGLRQVARVQECSVSVGVS